MRSYQRCSDDSTQELPINKIQDMNKIKDRNHRISSLDTQKAFGNTKYIFMENHLENQVRDIILKKIPQRWKDKHNFFFFFVVMLSLSLQRYAFHLEYI